MLTSTTFAAPLNKKYVEIPQDNPIRWCIYHYNSDKETFTAQTAWFKCKDFFNDVVCKYNDVEGPVYGMNTKSMKLNEYGVWIRLKNLHPAFYKNAIIVAEKFKVTPTLAPFEDDASQCLTLFPRELFESTYKISLFTLLLRVANMKEEATCYEELLKLSKEPLLTHSSFKRAPLEVPEKLKKYWCYMGKNYNSEEWGIGAVQIHVIHNNGFINWIQSDNMGAFQ